MAAHPEFVVEPPPPRRRRLIVIGILVFLGTQLAIPVSYYLGDEPTSERFSWRMFSSIDLSSWNTRLTVVVEEQGKTIEQEVPLQAILQESHGKLVQRAQFDIVEPLMRMLAARPGVQEVRYVAQGFFPSGAPMKPVRLAMKPGQPLQRLVD